jgi:NDP-sugar pyrophosphorylase family protein
VAGRPFLDYLLSWLQIQGVKEVVLCVGHKRSHIQRFVGRGRKWGLQAKYSIEDTPLGTGGALKQAEHQTSGETLLVVNGDTLVDLSLGELVKFHQRRKALATLAMVKVVDGRRYGSLYLDGKNRITAFLEKSHRAWHGSKAEKGLVNGGVYVFERKLLKTIRAGSPISLEKEVFPSLLAKKGMHGFATNAFFLDIGIPEDLERAQRELPERIPISHPR